MGAYCSDCEGRKLIIDWVEHIGSMSIPNLDLGLIYKYGYESGSNMVPIQIRPVSHQ